MRRWLWLQALAIPLGVTVVMACSGVALPPDGEGGAAGAGGQGGSGGSMTMSSSASGSVCDQGLCAKCVECARMGPCAAQSKACDENPDCIAMNACDDGCGGNNPPCEALCEEAHSDGVPGFKALKSCTTSACPMSCGAGGG